MSETRQEGPGDSGFPGDTSSRGRWFGPGWPLTTLYLGYPLWWAMGWSQMMFFAMAVAMAAILVRKRGTHVPRGFGIWLLFLAWVVVGVLVLWAHAPGTVPGGGAGRLLGFGVRLGWYLSVTVAMLYVLNTARELATLRVVRLLGWMFIVTAGFGILASVAPNTEFPSLMEVILPSSLTSSNFVYTLIHPSVATTSEFLGYVQPRPTAPFPYSNAWGNNLALFLPFFVLAWLGPHAGWRRQVAPLVLGAAAIPVVYSLNRGLWVAIGVATVYVALRLAFQGRVLVLQVLVAVVTVGGLAFVSSPLYDTVQLRMDTPHSNERRASVATDVVAVTAKGSPVVGYGSTRTKQGSYSSLAGAGTPECRQCAPPPLGTQGFMWRLVLTTGFAGTVLCLWFLGLHLARACRRTTPLELTVAATLLAALACFFVYDSLGSALFTVMIAVGLLARQELPDEAGGT